MTSSGCWTRSGRTLMIGTSDCRPLFSGWYSQSSILMVPVREYIDGPSSKLWSTALHVQTRIYSDAASRTWPMDKCMDWLSSRESPNLGIRVLAKWMWSRLWWTDTRGKQSDQDRTARLSNTWISTSCVLLLLVHLNVDTQWEKCSSVQFHTRRLCLLQDLPGKLLLRPLRSQSMQSQSLQLVYWSLVSVCLWTCLSVHPWFTPTELSRLGSFDDVLTYYMAMPAASILTELTFVDSQISRGWIICHDYGGSGTTYICRITAICTSSSSRLYESKSHVCWRAKYDWHCKDESSEDLVTKSQLLQAILENTYFFIECADYADPMVSKCSSWSLQEVVMWLHSSQLSLNRRTGPTCTQKADLSNSNSWGQRGDSRWERWDGWFSNWGAAGWKFQTIAANDLLALAIATESQVQI